MSIGQRVSPPSCRVIQAHNGIILTAATSVAAGTSFLALLQPPGRPVPPDGLRYYYPEANGRRTVSQHVVHAPNSVANPTAASPVDVILECFTTACGHLPPMSPTQPIPSGSPDLRLTRFRKRWRIVNGSQPSLWFFWWGDDDSGGLGPGHVAPNAPPGWESTPVRTYPLPQLGNVPSAPLYPFPSPARMPPGQATPYANAPTNGRSQAVQQADGAMAPPATPLARQQQLAALASQAGVGMQGGTTSTLEARQQQYHALAQQQQQQAAALAAAAAASGGNANPSGAMLPPGLTPQQISAAQARQAQQYMLAQQQQQRHQQQQQLQQQQQQQQQQRATAATAAAQTLGTSTSSSSRGGNNSRRKSTASSAAHAAQSAAAAQQAAAAAAAAAEEAAAARPGDILDHLTHRQQEMHRYALQHQLLAPVFDPWSTSEILAGEPLVGRAKSATAATNGVSPPPSSSLLPGLGRRPGPLSQLAVTAARIPVTVAKGEDLAKIVGVPVEARRAKLEEMLRKIEDETKKQDEWYREQVAGLTSTATSRLGSEVSTPAVAAGENASAAK